MGAVYGVLGELDSNQLSNMGRRLSHRGHFASETRISNQCWFGRRAHTPEGGVFQDDYLAVVTDATLFNADELRAEIESSGYRFSSDATEEIIAAGYRRFGRDLFRRLHGDFAIVIWNEREQTLTLARDPVSTRPIYIWHDPARTIFASEYKAILAIDEVPAQPDLDVLQHIQYAKFPPPNRTAVKGIASVPPGYWVEFSRAGRTEERYWDLKLDLHPRSEHEHIERVRQDLRRAVRRRIEDQDVVGINLSSGIDSAAILAVARQEFPEMTIHSFTAGDSLDDPEMVGAGQVADYCATIHHPLVMDPNRVPEVLPTIVWHLEDPIARTESVQNFELGRAAAKHVSVLLGGYLGDTLFAGNDKYKLLKLMQWLPPLKVGLTEFYDYSQTSTPPLSISGRAIKELYYRGSEPVPPRIRGASWVPHHSSFDPTKPEMINAYLIGILTGGHRSMPKIERLPAAHGVTIRQPFLDKDLMTTAFQIPERYKIRRWREKHILREAVRPYLPPAALNRPKFAAQMRSDHAFSAMLFDYARDVLSTGVISDRGFFDPTEIAQLLERRGRPYPYGRAMRIWTAIMTELWARAFLDRRGAPLVQDAAYDLPTNPSRVTLA